MKSKKPYSDFSEELIKQSGLKSTKGRIAVLDLLKRSKKPLSAEVISDQIPSIDSVTVYRILKAFVKKGIIYQTDFRDGKAYFEFQDNHHHHITCIQCGVREHTNVCVDDDTYKKVLKKSTKFNNVNSHMLEFFSLCKKCS